MTNQLKQKPRDIQYEQDIQSALSFLMNSLNNIDKIPISKVKDKELIQSFENIKAIILKGVVNIQSQLKVLSEVIEWDRLNVAFFGETNAGKSTLIEALVDGDGTSIGEGYKDFTETVETITYENIFLIDMPGIEGKESTVINEIQSAVNKSHVVFYVNGTNKEPEKHTITKIKQFLKDDVKVYSIINVRRKPAGYKYNKDLKDESIGVVEDRMKNIFSEVLGASYIDNIILGGYLALMNNNHLKKLEHKSDQTKALEIFDSKVAIAEHSNINELKTVINGLNKDIKDEILISNTYKFLKNISVMLSEIRSEKTNFDAFVKKANNLIKKYLKDIDTTVAKHESEAKSIVNTNINTLQMKLKKVVNHGITEGESRAVIEANINNVKKENEKKLNNAIKELSASMNNEIENIMQEFKDRMSLEMQFVSVKGEFNLEDILQTLEISFDYVLKQIFDVGLSLASIVMAFAFNVVLGIITSVVVLAKKIWEWLSGDVAKRKQQAKTRAIKEIDSMIKKEKLRISKDLGQKLAEVNKKVQEPALNLKRSMKEIKNISLAIEDKLSDILWAQSLLGQYLMSYILGEKIIFSYLDLELSEAVCVGYAVSPANRKYLAQKFRINKINAYSSYNDWLGEAGKNNGQEPFVAKDEFNFRALNRLLESNKHNFKFNKVRRRDK